MKKILTSCRCLHSVIVAPAQNYNLLLNLWLQPCRLPKFGIGNLLFTFMYIINRQHQIEFRDFKKFSIMSSMLMLLN